MIVHFIVDLCKYMDKTLGNKFLDIIVHELKTTSNVIQPCPHVVSMNWLSWCHDKLNYCYFKGTHLYEKHDLK